MMPVCKDSIPETCAICCMSLRGKETQSLSCSHTFCSNCVQMLKGETKIQCPECKVYSDNACILILPADDSQFTQNTPTRHDTDFTQNTPGHRTQFTQNTPGHDPQFTQNTSASSNSQEAGFGSRNEMIPQLVPISSTNNQPLSNALPNRQQQPPRASGMYPGLDLYSSPQAGNPSQPAQTRAVGPPPPAFPSQPGLIQTGSNQPGHNQANRAINGRTYQQPVFTSLNQSIPVFSDQNQLNPVLTGQPQTQLLQPQQAAATTASPLVDVCRDEVLPEMCEVCGSVEDCVSYKCHNCDQYMCTRCHVSHKGLKSCLDHKVQPLFSADLSEPLKPVVINLKRDLQKSQRLVKDKEGQLLSLKVKVLAETSQLNSAKDNALEAIAEKEEAALAEVKRQHDYMRKQVNDGVMKSLQKLSIDQRHIDACLSDLGQKGQMLDQVISSRSDDALADVAGSVNAEVTQGLTAIDVKIASIKDGNATPNLESLHSGRQPTYNPGPPQAGRTNDSYIRMC